MTSQRATAMLTPIARRLRRAVARRLALLAFSGLALSCHPEGRAVEPRSLAKNSALLPARVRRLSNAELEQTATALLLYEVDLERRLPPDIRRDGYTRNESQALPTAALVRWASLADDLVGHATASGVERFIDCPSPACRDAFLRQSAARAWRRPLEAGELARLNGLFAQGVEQEGLAGGVRWALSALMQSPHFLYSKELGTETAATASAHRVVLTPYETADFLAYTLTGTPPDAQLMALAQDGKLLAPEVRENEARRLLSKTATRHHFRRFVLEWLEVDELADTAKTADGHPQYERLKAHMLEETRAYVDEVLVHHGATLPALLDSGFTSVDPSMARYYGFDAFGPAVASRHRGRAGLLQQASFLAAHSQPDRTSPVLRGDFVLRRLLCRRFPRPAELGIEVVMPQLSALHTTRELFETHTADPSCAACHQTIDALGFPFENFDEAGKQRRLEAGKPIDTRASLDFNGETVRFDGSLDVSSWLAKLPQTRKCFARQAFRYFSAQASEETEQAFLALVDELPRNRRDNLIEMLVAFAGSDLFLYRRLSP